jgi:hypothetical protein
MSYDVSLHDANGDVVQVDNHEEGGLYALGGTTDADLNITYNYGWFYHRCLDSIEGLNCLHEQKASDTIRMLETAVDELGTKTYKDYWAPTPGNAGHALNVLLMWAHQHPDATWQVS